MKYQIYLEINNSEELTQADPEAPYPEDEIAEDFHQWATATAAESAADTGRDKYSGKYLSEFLAELEEEVEKASSARRPLSRR